MAAPDAALAALLLDHEDDLVTAVGTALAEGTPVLAVAAAWGRMVPGPGRRSGTRSASAVPPRDRAALAAVIGGGLRLIAGGEPLDALGPAIERSLPVLRAGSGPSPEQYLRAYEAGQAALLDRVESLVRGHPDRGMMMAAFTRRLLEFQRVAALRARTASRPGAGLHDRPAEMQALLELMTGRRHGDALRRDLCRRLGLDRPVRVAAVAGPGADRSPAVLRRLGAAECAAVAGVLDDRLVVLAARRPRVLPSPAGLADVPEDAGPDEVAAAVDLASRTADAAARLGLPELEAADAAPLTAMLALPDEARDAYVRRCFGDLARTGRGRALLATVAAVLTHPRTQAAAMLHVHRHTLDYRLRRFEEQTGIDLADPAGRFRCELGLFLLGYLPYRG